MFFPVHVLVPGGRVLRRHISPLICFTVIVLKSVDLAAALPPPIQPVPEAALLALAQKKFGTLSRAEEELFRAAQEGRAASVLSKDEKENDPANAANWPAERAVRAACIAWICTDPQASALVTYRGLKFFGMRIDGALDLANADIKFHFVAWKCAFSDNILLQDTKARGFYLAECKTKILNAGRAIFMGSVTLRGLKAEGEINLLGTTIAGDLDCAGGQFTNTEGFALNASSAKIERDVYLGDGFKAKGEVNLRGATIAGDLDCEGGQFSNPGGDALVLESSKIGRNVFLRDGFQAQGEVNLLRATMGSLQILDVRDAEQTIFDLRLAKVEAFWDDEASWPKAENLFLDGFRYERLYEMAPFQAASRKKWLSLQPRDKFRPQPYEQLAAVLREMGHEPEAREVMIEKNRERARFTHFPHQGWWWYNLVGRFIGYGYEAWRAFAASLVMILIGRFLFRRGFDHDLIAPTSDNAFAKDSNGQQILEENGQPKILETYPVFNAFVYSLESFVPLLKLDQSANWKPNANRRSEVSILHRRVPYSGGFLRGYLYFHIAAGWLLTSLWVGAITGLVKT